MSAWQLYVTLLPSLPDEYFGVKRQGPGNEGENILEMESDQLSEDLESRSAPWLSVPPVPLVGIEHPCLITDIGRAVGTLGGSDATSKIGINRSRFLLAPWGSNFEAHFFLQH